MQSRSPFRLFQQHPFLGARYSSTTALEHLRVWPVAGFEAIAIYYIAESSAIRVVRILHRKRDVRRILARDPAS